MWSGVTEDAVRAEGEHHRRFLLAQDVPHGTHELVERHRIHLAVWEPEPHVPIWGAANGEPARVILGPADLSKGLRCGREAGPNVAGFAIGGMDQHKAKSLIRRVKGNRAGNAVRVVVRVGDHRSQGEHTDILVTQVPTGHPHAAVIDPRGRAPWPARGATRVRRQTHLGRPVSNRVRPRLALRSPLSGTRLARPGPRSGPPRSAGVQFEQSSQELRA